MLSLLLSGDDACTARSEQLEFPQSPATCPSLSAGLPPSRTCLPLFAEWPPGPPPGEVGRTGVMQLSPFPQRPNVHQQAFIGAAIGV
eukprot:9873038-Alexandrium_andersonii.AAC.1